MLLEPVGSRAGELIVNVFQAILNFKIRMQGYDSDYYDPFIVDIRNTSNNVLERVITLSFAEWNDQFKDSGWISDDDNAPEGFDVSGYAGQTIRIYFDQANLYDDLYETWTYIDEVSLLYSMYVDLTADGNGADVFGGLGTGLGAYSAKSGVAGDTLRYQLQVKNEGTVADTYQLSVNAPGGCTVLIDDGPAIQAFPYTTVNIPAGGALSYAVLVIPPPATTASII